MAFGWGAGDVVQVVKFIADVASALDDVEGAGKEFRQASSFLRNLDQALLPLQTLTALDANPLYKNEIGKQVTAIRTPLERFIKDVKGMEAKLGVEPCVVRFRHLNDFRHIPHKLEWHYFTSKKAIRLQNEIDQHIQIIDTLMQRLTVEMLHTLKSDMKGDMIDSIGGVIPLLKETMATELSKDDRISRDVWMKQLEDLFERYLGPQHLGLKPGITFASTTSQNTFTGDLQGNSMYTSDMLKTAVSHWDKRFFFQSAEDNVKSIGSFSTNIEVADRIRQWWATEESSILCIQGFNNTNESSLAVSMAQLTRSAQIPTVTYTCQRYTTDGTERKIVDVFIDLLYSLIYQIIHELPADFLSTLDFTTSRFVLLDGSVTSIQYTLALLKDLLSLDLGQVRHSIILDEFQLFDYSGDAELESRIREFLRLLQEHDEEQKILKTMIITEDQSTMLLEQVDVDKYMDASRSVRMNGYLAVSDIAT